MLVMCSKHEGPDKMVHLQLFVVTCECAMGWTPFFFYSLLTYDMRSSLLILPAGKVECIVVG